MLGNKRIQTLTQCVKSYSNAVKTVSNKSFSAQHNSYNRPIYKLSAMQFSTYPADASEKVNKLAEEVLNLDLLEMNQLLKYIQVK